MGTMIVKRGMAAALLLVCAGACSQRDSTEVEPLPSGGTGGSSTQAGGTGGSGASVGSAGAGGSGGSQDTELPDAGPARFRALLAGDRVNFTSVDPVWFLTCENNPQLLQRVNDAWVLLRDERPGASDLEYRAHYLDGAYHPDCLLGNGCHVAACELLNDQVTGYRAREYVRVRESKGRVCGVDGGLEPVDAGDAGAPLVPELESRAASGPLGVRIRYFRDSQCRSQALTTDVAVE